MIRATTLRRSDREWLHAELFAGPDLLPFLSGTTLRITSWSMYPTIRKGDRIELAPADCLGIGDLVVYRRAGALICHRVTGIDPNGFVLTTADSSSRGIDTVPVQELVGCVTRIHRGGRRLSPARIQRPAPLASVHRFLDEVRSLARRHLRSIASLIIECLASYPAIRGIFGRLLLTCLRFTITERMPVTSLALLSRQDRSLSSRRFQDIRLLLADVDPVKDLVILASLGCHVVGSLTLPSGEQEVHPQLANLGLEESWSQLSVVRMNCRSDPPSPPVVQPG